MPFFSNLVMIIFLSFLSFGMLEVVDCYDVGLHWEMVLLSWRIGVDCNYAAMEGNSALRAVRPFALLWQVNGHLTKDDML